MYVFAMKFNAMKIIHVIFVQDVNVNADNQAQSSRDC